MKFFVQKVKLYLAFKIFVTICKKYRYDSKMVHWSSISVFNRRMSSEEHIHWAGDKLWSRIENMEVNTAAKVDYAFISKIEKMASNSLWMKRVIALILLVPNIWMKKNSKPTFDELRHSLILQLLKKLASVIF